jgi:hypothetical protein
MGKKLNKEDDAVISGEIFRWQSIQCEAMASHGKSKKRVYTN